MELKLERVEQRQGASTHLYPLDLALVPNAVTVLLGATQAGKTTLMRLMAGLDRPAGGRVFADGEDVTGKPVRERNVSMVYQQFVNYPSMTVADNIASPMKLRGDPDIAARVDELAGRLHIRPFLGRLPAELSGGQQQRVALARALAKQAPLMLLDEPLVNLDYKLREGLREELSQLFAAGTSTVVYATTEPTEALLLGGYTAVMAQGELLQYGPTAEVFHRPRTLRVARAFSDPPMNLIEGRLADGGLVLADGSHLPIAFDGARTPVRDAVLSVGIRAGALKVRGDAGDVALPGRVELAEIAGSDTFVHVDTPAGELVAQLTGVHVHEIGSTLTLYLPPSRAYVFDPSGDCLVAPRALLDTAH